MKSNALLTINKLSFYYLKMTLKIIISLSVISITIGNLFESEKKSSQIEEQTNQNSSYIINEEISKFYPFVNEINVYISILNGAYKNKLVINNTRTDYLRNYTNMLGKTEKFFPKEKNNRLPFLHDTVTNNKTTLHNSDDVLIRKVILVSNQSERINLFFMRNQYVSHLEDVFSNMQLYNLYDMNIFYNLNQTNYNDDNDKLFIMKEKTNITDENDFIDTFIEENNYEKIINFSTVKRRISLLRSINLILSQLTSLSSSKINLMNYMLHSQIMYLKEQLKQIEKNLLPLIYYKTKSTEDKMNALNTKVINLVSYLNQFDFRKSDIGIDISYSLFLIIALLIVGYIISVIIREFKAAFERKVK